MKNIGGFALKLLGFAVGLWLGISLADFDQSLFFLQHRSILTHGILLFLLIFFLAPIRQYAWLRTGLMGDCIGMAVHLNFDLVPRGWSGYALITLPIYGRLPMFYSILWIGMNVIACLYLALWLADDLYEVIACGIGLLIVFSAASANERVVDASVFLILAIALTLVLPEPTQKTVRSVAGRLKMP